MEEAAANDYLTLLLSVFVLGLSLFLFYLYRGSREVQNELKGKDGYRLITIFVRLFLIGAISGIVSALRNFSIIIWPDAELFRIILTGAIWTLTLGADIWALLSVRAIIRSGQVPEDLNGTINGDHE